MISRICVLICSSRAFDRSLVRAACTLGELEEGLKPGLSGPRQPRLEQREPVLGGNAVDLAQLLGEQIGNLVRCRHQPRLLREGLPQPRTRWYSRRFGARDQ
jgi:hypothetical protein